MFHFFEDPKRFMLITELCEGGELLEYMQSQKKMESNKAAHIIKQILSAVKFMHQKGYVHRDLKPENVLLERKGDPNNLKLIDFGTAFHF